VKQRVAKKRKRKMGRDSINMLAASRTYTPSPAAASHPVTWISRQKQGIGVFRIV
jgi:hypothetical protein